MVFQLRNFRLSDVTPDDLPGLSQARAANATGRTP
jgi:hypothetical protein